MTGIVKCSHLAACHFDFFGPICHERLAGVLAGEEPVEGYASDLGTVPDGDLPALYTGAACAAVPSLYEGFGLPLLEAMACGAPVLCSDVSSLPEVAGDAALLLDPHDTAAWAEALRSVVADAVLQESLRAHGLARAQQFSWSAIASSTLDLYHSLAG